MERCFEVKTRAVEAEGQEGQKETVCRGYAVRFNSPHRPVRDGRRGVQGTD